MDIAVPNSKEDAEKQAPRVLYVVSGEKSSRVRRTKAIEMAN